MNLPENLKYTKSHEYLNEEGNKATVGISAYASSELGDVVFIELPEVGKKLNAGDKFGVIESVKSVSDLYTPIGGTITAVNTDLENNPQFVNEDPYGKGWMIKLENLSKDNAELVSANEYKDFVLSIKH